MVGRKVPHTNEHYDIKTLLDSKYLNNPEIRLNLVRKTFVNTTKWRQKVSKYTRKLRNTGEHLLTADWLRDISLYILTNQMSP